MKPTRDSHVVVAAAIATTSFLGGLGFATYLLRLRDRERLRNACSRVQKHIVPSQRSILGAINLSLKRDKRQTVLVVGAGSYGTAMAHVAAVNGHDVILYMRDPEQCKTINKKSRNPKYLSDYALNPNGKRILGICTEEDLKEAFQIPNVVAILALPCQLTPVWIKNHRDIIPQDVLLCSTSKGLYLPTQQLIGHAILDALDRASQPLCFLSGPSFAEEIVKGFPTAVVIASDKLYLAARMQKIMSNKKSFRVYTSQDPIGVQLGGALKNPLAVGAGMIAGMGFGTNTLSACVTRASRELQDLCISMGGRPETINGLSGIGDLMLTCFSSQSRNQRCGQRLIKGESIEEISKDYTVEGVPTADVAVVYADLCNLDSPIFRTVHKLIHKKLSPEEAVNVLMGRPLNTETSRANLA